MACSKPIPYAVQRRTVRHQADRGAEGPAGRSLRTRCHRRRHHHPHGRSDRAFRGQHPARGRQWGVREGAARRQRTDRRGRDPEVSRIGNYYNTDGYLQQLLSEHEGRPVQGLLRTAAPDLEAHRQVHRRSALIVRSGRDHGVLFCHSPRDESNPFSQSVRTPPDANDTITPITNNNLGTDNRDVLDTALKLDFGLDYGTVTSITDYNDTKEIDTGDAYDFRPVPNSLVYLVTQGIPPSRADRSMTARASIST